MKVHNGFLESDIYYMNLALREAKTAFENSEVPVGAVVVIRNQVMGRAYNQVELLQDATAHAEMLAISAAMDYVGTKFLIKASIYVSVEPCLMCFGAIQNARISRIVYGVKEPKYGFSNFLVGNKHIWNGEILGGLLSEAAAGLMQEFFNERRK